jgi:hypothetical protein
MAWSFSIGNLAQRAAVAPAVVAPAASDALLPLTNLATGYPDQEGSFTWRSDGIYKVDLDCNMLAASSSKADAPTGWRDLLLGLAGTPGLNANPPEQGTFAARTALKVYAPSYQDVEVMPGEDFKLDIGLYRPSAGTATAAQVEVIDTWSGKGWNGSAWANGGILLSQSTADAWSDVSEEITADTNRTVRSTYRVVITPVAASYGATTYVYASFNAASGYPALYAKADFAALIGHNIPADATVSIGTHSLTTISPISTHQTFTAEYRQTWRVDIAMPSGNQVRPKIGEVWIGRLETFTRGIDPGINLKEGDLQQIRVTAAQGRQEILSDLREPNKGLKMNVRTFTDASFYQYRDTLTRGTRFGADPLLLLPPAGLEGAARLVHGRVGSAVGYKHQEAGWREFTVSLMESPFSGRS